MMADSARAANKGRVTKVILACVGVGVFLFVVLLASWCFWVYKHRHYHVKHLRKLDAEAKALHNETIKVKREIDLDLSADDSTRLQNLGILTSAEEWDTAINIALSAWGDLVSENRKKEPGPGAYEAAKVNSGRKKGYAFSIIGIMREKSMEGVERRKELSPQLQRIFAEAHARRVEHFKSSLNVKLPTGQKSSNASFIRPALTSVQSSSFESLYQTKPPDPPLRAVSVGLDGKKAKDEDLGGLYIYL